MADAISYTGLITSLFLPWFLGCVWVRWLLVRSGRWNWFIVAGQGYFVGIFVTTLIIRLCHWAGIDLHFSGMAGAILFLCVAGILLQKRQTIPDREPVITVAFPRWQKTIVMLLIGLVAWRYMTILQEILIRPLYAWDTWMNWAPRAIVWFHHNDLTPFVSPGQWLLQAEDAQSYTLGNRRASLYPPTVPLIQLWSMMGAGTWDHSTIYLPWMLAAGNIGLALYGHLRLAGSSILASTIACYLLLSLPYLNVHSVLVGYADIWLACAFGLAVFALHEWRVNRHWSYAVLCVFMACCCSQLKIPGIILAFIIAIAGLRTLLSFNYRTEVSAAVILIGTVTLLLLSGLDIDVPYLGHFSINRNSIEVPIFGSFSLEYHSVSSAFIESMLVMLNWNLLWYLLVLLSASLPWYL